MATEFSIVEKEVKGVPQPNFEDNANILSGWFVTYLDPLFEKGVSPLSVLHIINHVQFSHPSH